MFTPIRHWLLSCLLSVGFLLLADLYSPMVAAESSFSSEKIYLAGDKVILEEGCIWVYLGQRWVQVEDIGIDKDGFYLGNEAVLENCASSIARLLCNRRRTILGCYDGKFYLDPTRVKIDNSGLYVQDDYITRLPSCRLDSYGLFLHCGSSADEHFEKARDALFDAIGHSMGAGAAAAGGIAPLAIYEGYRAVEAWKESAEEYLAGKEAEKEKRDD